MRRTVGAVAAKRGEKRTLCLGLQFLGNGAEQHRALSTPPQASCPLKKNRQSLTIVRGSAHQARAESDNPALFLQSRGNDASCFGRCIDFNLNFPLPRFQTGKDKTLTCALVAEQSRTSPASSGRTAAPDRVPIRWKGRKRGAGGGGKKKQLEKKDQERVSDEAV